MVSTSSLTLGTTIQGTAGSSQSFTVSGSNLAADIILTAPSGVELSDDFGTDYRTTLDLAELGGAVGTTTILTRISVAAAPGTVSEVIAADSDGATEQDISVSSTVNQPLTLTSITPASPNPRNLAVSSIDVTFSEPINTSSLAGGALTLTDNGGANLIDSGVSLTLVSGNVYSIGGLSGLTTQQGEYTLTVNVAEMTDQNGVAGTGSLSTSWLMDTTPAKSTVNSLLARETSLVFPVSVTGSDGGSPPSGVYSYDIYASINGGAWKFWISMPASSPTADYTGQSNTTYAFYSIAHDYAGNTEVTQPGIETSTYVPNLTPPATQVGGLTGTNPSKLNTTTGTFTLNITGNDPGGGLLTQFEVYVSTDGGAYQEVGPYAIPAGAADSSGNYHSSIPYQGLTDGKTYSYAFYSVGLDSAGNLQSAPASPNVNFSNQTFAEPGALAVTSFSVEHESPSRSFIRYLGIGFNESDLQSVGALTSIMNSLATGPPDIQIYKYDLNGTAASKTAISLSGVSVKVLDHALEIDFGTGGIGGNANTTAADGYYEVDIRPSASQLSVHHFDRLLGDITGDGIVDTNDLNEIAASINESTPTGWSPLSADVTGAGTVTTIDLTLATRSKTRKLAAGLALG